MVSDSDRLSATGEAVSWNPVPDAEQRQPRRACKRRSWQYMNVGVYVFNLSFSCSQRPGSVSPETALPSRVAASFSRQAATPRRIRCPS